MPTPEEEYEEGIVDAIVAAEAALCEECQDIDTSQKVYALLHVIVNLTGQEGQDFINKALEEVRLLEFRETIH